ncbi:MAG TPA: M23 family metallopeptidase [Gemmatimonadales bacterium]|nr:M23 family metallopeptidase [Gemmatimonadales bacterium]
MKRSAQQHQAWRRVGGRRPEPVRAGQRRVGRGHAEARGLRTSPRRLATALLASAALAIGRLATPGAAVAQSLPPLPDSTGWGVHVLAAARDPGGTIWLGTYGQGMLRLAPGATTWERIRHDSSATSISWDYIQAIAFGPRGEVWYGTVGNGWGLSTDGGRTWRNWTLNELGPEWQYVAPDGIVARSDTTVIATADGLQLTTDQGAHWLAFEDSIGPESKGPADSALRLLPNEYVRRIAAGAHGWIISTLHGNVLLRRTPEGWTRDSLAAAPFTSSNALLIGRRQYHGTPCGLRPVTDSMPCLGSARRAAEPPKDPRTIWFRRPIDLTDNAYIDQTYRYGSTMGGNFQVHQGVEFNNPDGTPVYAIGSGTVVYAGPAEQGALTVAIRHDSTVTVGGKRRAIFSTYYHNSRLLVKVGQQVRESDKIAEVGHTGRATNDHLHLEVHVAPADSVRAIVDSLNRFPPYTTNPELWITPMPGTGIVAGRVLDAAGQPVPGAKIYGLVKPDPRETPFSYAECYGDNAHPHPLYGEHFAVSDVPAGAYVLGTEIDGRKVLRRVTVEPGKLTWVVFKP